MEKGSKALRKMQHSCIFLNAFGAFDLLFGVPRGE